MLNKDYTAKLLNLEDVIITNVENISGEVHVYLELSRAKHRCPTCGALTDYSCFIPTTTIDIEPRFLRLGAFRENPQMAKSSGNNCKVVVSRAFYWRRRRDLNPRYPFGVYTISNRLTAPTFSKTQHIVSNQIFFYIQPLYIVVSQKTSK